MSTGLIARFQLHHSSTRVTATREKTRGTLIIRVNQAVGMASGGEEPPKTKSARSEAMATMSLLVFALTFTVLAFEG